MKSFIILVMIGIVVFLLCQQRKTEKQKNNKEFLLKYIPSSQFEGYKKGYVFKTENNLTGYYWDVYSGR